MKYTLHYFPLQGRGEPIRLAFVLAGIAFKNVALTFPQFQEKAATFPTGILPVLDIIDGNKEPIVIDQSIAILRYIGKLDGALYPKDDPLAALQVDRMIYLAEDANSMISITVRGPAAYGLVDEESPSWTKEEILAIRKRMMDPHSKTKNIAFFLQKLEDRLASSKSGFLVGNNVTIADLRVHHLVSWLSSGILDGIDAKTFAEAYPKLIALKDKVEAIPSVAAFREKYGTMYKDFEYTP